MLALVLAVGSVANFGASEYLPGPQVHIALTVYQGDPLGSREAGTVHVVSQPQLVVRSGRPGSVRCGQDVTFTRPGGTTTTEQTGVLVEFLPITTANGNVWVEMNAQVREVHFGLGLKTGAGGFVPGFTEQAVRVAWIPKPGEPVRHRLAAQSASDQTWVEVTVRPVK